MECWTATVDQLLHSREYSINIAWKYSRHTVDFITKIAQETST